MFIDIHGLVINTHCRSEELLSRLLRPFKYFLGDSGPAAVEIHVQETLPPYDSFPRLKARFSTPRNIVFRGAGIKIIDYFGKGVVVEEDRGRKFTVYGTDPNFLCEAFYLLVLSKIGQHCDKQGIFRIHALAFSFRDTAIIFSAGAGGGKSTMAFSLLESDSFKLISDDEAHVNHAGCVLPFPVSIGTLNVNRTIAIPASYVYEIDRMEFGKKYFIDPEYWNHRIEKRGLDKKIYIAARRLINGDPYIEKISGYKAFISLIGPAVVGLGLYQGIEFVFNNSIKEILSLVPVLFKRTVLAVKLVKNADPYRIYLSRDTEKNYRVFEEFIRNL